MRSRKLVFLAHCLLNQAARALGREAPDAVRELLSMLAAAGVGIVQLPCPALEFNGGLDREAKAKQQHDTPDYRAYCRWLGRWIAGLVERYTTANYSVLGVIGVETSPHCAVWQLTTGSPGKGILTEELEAELRQRRLAVPLIGANLNNIWATLEQLAPLLGRRN